MELSTHGVSADQARIRNLRISIAKGILANRYAPLHEYRIEEISKAFYFKKRDLKYYLKKFFICNKKRYILSENEFKLINAILEKNKKALQHLEQAQVIFIKTFGKFYDSHKQEGKFNREELSSIYKRLNNVIPVLHWGRLPIINRYLMINSGNIPEKDVLKFYNHYDMLSALFLDIMGKGEVMSTMSDETLDKKMNFEVYTRRYSHRDSYKIKRTIDGWHVSHIAINGECKKDGSEILFANLHHDGIFFPEEGVKYALERLWEMAEDGKLTLEELQTKIQEVADWISVVEQSVGEGQPDWVNYY